MANKNEYLEFVTEQFAPLGTITSRAMFGGHTLYCSGVIFALLANNALYLKVDDQNRPEFQARGLEPFRPFENQNVTMQYYLAPPEIFEDSDALEHWGGGAVAAGRRAQAKRTTRTAGRKRSKNVRK